MRRALIVATLLATVLSAADVEIGTTGPPKGFPFGC